MQIKQKAYYNRRARSRKFDVGDKVLLLLPTDSNKLLLHWKGPYEVDEMLTDCGSQFTAEVMKEVSRLLSLQQITTTPYHPICNGLIERFHMTLKQMLRRMCAERPKDWDKYLPALLFAIREVPQESLGFSPFELLYGRNVKGPMAILRDLWSGEAPDEQVLSTYQYVIE